MDKLRVEGENFGIRSYETSDTESLFEAARESINEIYIDGFRGVILTKPKKSIWSRSAGVVSGLVAGGIGSRIVMRISAIATGPSCSSMSTENDNVCGQITLDGTVELVLFAGIFSGVVGGFVYVAVRPWLGSLG